MTEPFDPHRPKAGLFARLRANFLTGLVVIAPVGLTVWFIWSLAGWVDGVVLPLVPSDLNPEKYIGINLRGLGVIFFLLFTVIVGWIAKGMIGRYLIRAAESVVLEVPFVRSIYSGVKQIAETVFAQSERNFEKACLIEYPRKGMWAVGFVSARAKGEVTEHIGPEKELTGVFLPTTPNPTSGYLLFVPRKDITELDMTIEDAAKLVISAGLVYPGMNGSRKPEAEESISSTKNI